MELEAQSHRLFGTTKQGFKYDESMVPKLDIPDLSNFELKPYVSYKTPLKLPKEIQDKIDKLNDYSKFKL